MRISSAETVLCHSCCLTNTTWLFAKALDVRLVKNRIILKAAVFSGFFCTFAALQRIKVTSASWKAASSYAMDNYIKILDRQWTNAVFGATKKLVNNVFTSFSIVTNQQKYWRVLILPSPLTLLHYGAFLVSIILTYYSGSSLHFKSYLQKFLKKSAVRFWVFAVSFALFSW